MKISNKASLPTKYGNFKIQSFKEHNLEHLVIFTEDLPSIPMIRIHSECMTGDVFKSIKCDCGEQLDFAMKKISKDGGMIIYLRQEGRGIGLFNKVNAYHLQDLGHDTIEANTILGFSEDLRDYKIINEILEYYEIKKIKLLTNNPLKINSIKSAEVIKRVPIVSNLCEYNFEYLKTKKEKMGHML